ncbi:Glutathione peroxidase [Candida maltosa Xu316]|uniref:Glutathione peroxidase n=1 Tax=Candida maltosa (strain Xu316) TaxID=1245528 RepID=M3HEW3_CANMX|nr:Glutathione peroxidase [Candida maltosa Xu316]
MTTNAEMLSNIMDNAFVSSRLDMAPPSSLIKNKPSSTSLLDFETDDTSSPITQLLYLSKIKVTEPASPLQGRRDRPTSASLKDFDSDESTILSTRQLSKLSRTRTATRASPSSSGNDLSISRSLRDFDSDESTLGMFRQSIQQPRSSFYDLCPLDNKKQPFPFEQLKGKVVLIVNVASFCTFTFQYKGLEEISRVFADDPFIIIGFPCNQFLWQEPRSNEQIVTTCKARYNVSFPILNKVHVNGESADPVYKYLKSQKDGIWGTRYIKWNFEKFLIDKEGNVVERYSTLTRPVTIIPRIEELLNNKST